MSHLDPEQLALIALGEPVASDDERSHLTSCAVCAAEVAEMTHAVVVARSTMDETQLDAPPARVWSSIVDELGLSVAVASDPLAVQTTTAVQASTIDTDSETARPAAVEAESEASPSSPPPATRRGSRATAGREGGWSVRSWWALAASAALVLAVGAGVWVGLGSLTPTSIATAALEAFPSHPEAIGTAEVDESRDGSRTLKVSLDGEVESSAYREVWLIRNDGAALISLGVLEGASGTFPIPDGVDLSEYDLVDISFEPVDGDPAHSGDSIVRGQLEFA